ncbi:MAG: glycosyltransferase, partial [Caldilineaceae bacterium]|nr:glycosyltransferase [Caldilineaceae bacterium]
HDLVIIGQAHGEDEEPQLIAQQLGLRQQIHWLDNTSDDELTAAYTAADLFVLVSFYEGFGLPILEAMQCDTPVIASSTTSAGEVTGAGGVTVDPTQLDAIATAIDTILQTPGERDAWIRNGRQWRQRFSWQRAAAETLALYEDVLRKQE